MKKVTLGSNGLSETIDSVLLLERDPWCVSLQLPYPLSDWLKTLSTRHSQINWRSNYIDQGY